MTRAPRRRDPAPSRLRYRLTRWWLRPAFRTLVRRGVPLVVFAGVGAYVFGPDANRAAMVEQARVVWDSVQERPEYMVNLMSIDGAGAVLDDEIRQASGLDLPQSSFDIDVETVRARLLEIPAVKQAHLRIRPGGILQVDVIERQPALIWRTLMGLTVLDVEGIEIAQAVARADHPDLPLIAGQGAAGQVDEALRLFRAAAPIGSRVRGLVRVGNRRWDLVLDGGQRVLLPPQDPVAALDRVIHLHQERGLLAFDVTQVDMRLPLRPTVRKADRPVGELDDDGNAVAGSGDGAGSTAGDG